MILYINLLFLVKLLSHFNFKMVTTISKTLKKILEMIFVKTGNENGHIDIPSNKK